MNLWESPEETYKLIEQLKSYCPVVSFNHGDALRQKGEHYKDMYIILDGKARVDTDGKKNKRSIERVANSPIGEIGFLRGTAANARVTATDPMRALYITDESFKKLKVL